MKKILLTITIIFLILFLSFRLVVFDFDFYKKEFEKHNIYDKLGRENVDNLSSGLITYLEGKSELKNKIFSNKESLHLIDVKNLIKKSFSLFYVVFAAFILLLMYSLYKKDKKTGNVFIFGGILTLLLILVIFLLAKISFDYLFTQFHYLSFDNELWLLNEKDILINLFPIGIFYDFLMRIILNNCFFAFGSIVFGIFLNKVLSIK
ncbi:hypothetical protein CL621_01850 [archaeon]|nr:hypothetical protein [archaeon]